MRLVQISDLHLSTMAATAADGRMVRYTEAQVRDGHPNGGDNLAGLAAVLDAVEEQAPDFSRLVVTGDIAQDEQAETYGLLRDQLARRGWLPRVLVLPGNHEQRDFLREAFPEQYRDDPPPHGGFAVTEGGWRLVGVDTHDTDAKLGWDGEMETLRDWDGGEGRLGGEQLSWLRQELNEHSTMPTLVFMHHPPTDVGSRWLDDKGMIEAEGLSGFVRIVSPTYLLLKRPARCWLESGRGLGAQVSAAPQVRAIHSGHIHQAFDGLLQTDPHDEEEGTNTEEFGGSGFQSTLHSAIKVHAAPSTAYQQVPRTETAIAATAGDGELAMPGFRIIDCGESALHAWHQQHTTRVVRVPFPPDYPFEAKL